MSKRSLELEWCRWVDAVTSAIGRARKDNPNVCLKYPQYERGVRPEWDKRFDDGLTAEQAVAEQIAVDLTKGLFS